MYNNSFPVSGRFLGQLITFADSLDSNKAQLFVEPELFVGPDLDPV